jgi:NADPH:quinone reductase-like Zn-dependent oxidoreductase
VAACGLAGGADLATTVYPFILRNVALLGINSVDPPRSLSARAWERLAHRAFVPKLDSIASLEPLSGIKNLCQQILDGQVRGRVVIDVNA